PFVILVAVRFGLRGATLATAIVSTIAVWGTTLGMGPFEQAILTERLLFVQVFIAVTSITALFLGAAIEERRRPIVAREELLATVSHDLRNPLSAVQVSAGHLAKKLGVGGEVSGARELAVLLRSTERMRSLLSDLLDRAAIESGHLSLIKSTHDLALLAS